MSGIKPVWGSGANLDSRLINCLFCLFLYMTASHSHMKRILALPLAIHVGVGTSSWHDGPRSVPAGRQLSRRTQANPSPLDLQQVRLHAHSPMVFVGSSMGERPGAPCTVDM